MFGQFSNLIYATSTRAFGSIKTNGEFNRENLSRFAQTIGVPKTPIVLMKQVHGNGVGIVENSEREIIGDRDGIVTNKRGIMLGVVTADCLPIALYEPEKQIVGIVHAGYKGILKGILEEVVGVIDTLGGTRQKMHVRIGPSIGECCYNVSQERIDLFRQKFGRGERAWSKRNDQFFLHLQKAARLTFMKLGIYEQHIEDVLLCTNCNRDIFFSFRGDMKETYGECVTIIGMR